MRASLARITRASLARHSRVPDRHIVSSRRAGPSTGAGMSRTPPARGSADARRVARHVGAAPVRGADGEDAAPTVVTYYE